MIRQTSAEQLKLELDRARTYFLYAYKQGAPEDKLKALKERYTSASDNYTAVRCKELNIPANIPGVIVIDRSEILN